MMDPIPGYEASPVRAQVIADLVRKAFARITLGGGIGLREGDGLDYHRTEDQLSKLREEDEKLDWQAITSHDLQRYNSAWHFLDDRGLIFHTPAFMLSELVGGGDDMILIRLCYPSATRDRLFAILNDEQKLAVRLFLMHLSEDDAYFESQRESIRTALDEFWVDPAIAQTTIGEESAASEGP